VARSDLRESTELPEGWASQVWQCAQQPGELLWVPDLMQHSTLNHHEETVGLAMVIDELQPLTPLHKAAHADAADEVRALLQAGGTEVDATARGDATALHHAAGMGHCGALEALLDGGASINLPAKASNGVTPLHAAAAAGHADAAAMLVRRGANVEARDQNGHTPLDLASQLGHDRVARVLSAKHAK